MKLFVTASAEARAERRWREQASGRAALAEVAAEMHRRDARDAGRDVAPLQPAADAVVLDTTALDADAAFAKALGIVRERLGSA